MQDFDDCKVIDFILNDSFVQWASGVSMSDDGYWSQYALLNPQKAEVFYQAKAIVNHLKINPVRDLSTEEVNRLVEQVLQKSDLPTNMPATIIRHDFKWYSSPSLFKIAAATLVGISLLAAALLTLKPQLFKTNQWPTTQETAFAQTTNETSAPIWVRLPDKTSVILKPGSQLRFPKQFSKTKREVYLTGEAFFEVTKNPHQPFFVYANEMTTRVLGTSFTVKAFKGDKDFKVIVNTGKVAVFAALHNADQHQKNQSVLVIPNQQATFHRKEETLIKNDLEKPLMLSEKVSKTLFNFNETPFSKVVDVIKKAYGVNISYNEKLANCPLTASLTDQPLYTKLDLICSAVEAHYDVADGEIVIDGKGCQNE